MRISLALALTACCLLPVGGWMERTKFAESYREPCFSPTRGPHSLVMGQRIPFGFTVSGFLDKVELLEEKLASETGAQDAVRTAGYILRQFYYHDYRWTSGGIVDAHFTQDWRDIVNTLFANMKPSAPNLPPLHTLLSEDEICFFVFSVAHNVNSSLATPRTRTEPETKPEEFPREEGVVTVTGSSRDAVALGRVLFGIEALRPSLQQPKEIREILGDHGTISPGAKTGKLYALESGTLGATLGGLVSLFGREELAKTLFLGGDWNGTGCFLEYQLQGKTNHSATRAELLGALDGYILGSYLSENPPLQKLKLSTILRAYYSTPGLLTKTGERLTYCNRKSLYETKKASSHLIEQLHNFAITLANKGRLTLSDKDGQARRDLDDVLRIFEGKLSEYTGQRSEACNLNFNQDQPKCETPTDIFVVLDSSSEAADKEDKRKLQSEILGTVLGKIGFQRNVSTVQVYVSKRDGTQLRNVVPQSAADGCAGCAAQFLRNSDYSLVGSDGVADVFNALNNTIKEYEMPLSTLDGVASKVVLYVNLHETNQGAVRGSRDQIVEALNRLRVGHPDVPVFAIGYKEHLEALNKESGALNIVDVGRFVSGERIDWSAVGDSTELKDLARKICQAPAGLQYHDCLLRSGRKEAESVFEGYVTPGNVQYWSYDSYYFSASHNLRIKFTADQNGDLKVCDMTGRVVDGTFREIRCRDTNPQEKTVFFDIPSPCKSGPRSCARLVYAVIGKLQQSPGQPLQEGPSSCQGFCRNPQQVKFTINHEGMYCGGMLSAVFSPLALLTTLAVTLANLS